MIVVNKKEDILERLKMTAVQNNKLIQVQVDLTYQCNCQCFFCYEGNTHINTRELLTTSEVKDVLLKIKKMGCLFLAFSGGEPFLRSDFIDLVEYAKEIGYIISIVTNLQVPNFHTLSKYISLNVYRTTVSFHALDQNLYCDIFGVNSSAYNHALNNIAQLIDSHVSVGIAATISNRNYNQMHLIKEYFLSKGLNSKDISFNLLVQGKNDILAERTNERMVAYLQAHQDLRENILPVSKGSGLCSAGRTSCTLTPYGDVLPCTFFNSSAGNIKDCSIEEIWNDGHLFKMLRKIKWEEFVQCKSCTNQAHCRICIANNLNETNSYCLPSTQYCTFRKGIIQAFLN